MDRIRLRHLHVLRNRDCPLISTIDSCKVEDLQLGGQWLLRKILANTAAYDSGGHGAASVVVADVNGDGKPDLVVANACSSGNANGCTDDNSNVNRDGKLDVLVSCGSVGDGVVGVLLNNGDGTFHFGTVDSNKQMSLNITSKAETTLHRPKLYHNEPFYAFLLLPGLVSVGQM
jgi:hypothetical protein